MKRARIAVTTVSGAWLVFCLALVLFQGCSSMQLAQEDVDSLHSIEVAAAKAYSYIDPDGGPSPSRAFDRMAYCNADAILRRNHLQDAGFDTKGMINCAPAGKQ